MNCPGSVRESIGAPDRASSYSIEGNAAHTLSEWCREHDRPASAYLGETVIVKEGGESYGVVVDQEMVDAVQAFVDFVSGMPGEVLIEARVSYDEYVPEGFGTLDDARLRPGAAVLTDLKYGKGVRVDAVDNEQLLLYALGVYLKYNWLYDFEQFFLYIHQPRLDHVDSWMVTTEYLLEWADTELRLAYARTQDENPAFKAGEWCQFCPIRATCKVRADSVFDDVVGDFDDVSEAVEMSATLTNDEIAKALDAIPQIEKWVADIQAYAMREVQQGRKVGDYKPVEGRGSREWGLDEEALKAAWAAAELDPLELYEPPKVLSVAKAEEQIGKKHALFQNETIVRKMPGKPTLAPGSDKRPPMKVDAAEEFDVLGEAE